MGRPKKVQVVDAGISEAHQVSKSNPPKDRFEQVTQEIQEDAEAKAKREQDLRARWESFNKQNSTELKKPILGMDQFTAWFCDYFGIDFSGFQPNFTRSDFPKLGRHPMKVWRYYFYKKILVDKVDARVPEIEIFTRKAIFEKFGFKYTWITVKDGIIEVEAQDVLFNERLNKSTKGIDIKIHELKQDTITRLGV